MFVTGLALNSVLRDVDRVIIYENKDHYGAVKLDRKVKIPKQINLLPGLDKGVCGRY